MENIISSLREAGLRDQVKVMIGGAPVTDKYATDIGADGFAPDAASAASRAKELVHEKRFSELKEITGAAEPEGWEEASQYLRAIVESEFFLGSHKSLPELKQVNTVEHAVNFAMGFEKETLLYFHAIRDVVKEKDVVDEIINEEKSHIMWLSRFMETFVKQA